MWGALLAAVFLAAYDGSAVVVRPGFVTCNREYVTPVFCNVGREATVKSPLIELYKDGEMVSQHLIPVLASGECRGASISPDGSGEYQVRFFQSPGWPFLNGDGWSDVCWIE